MKCRHYFCAITDVSGNGNNLSAWTQGGYAGFAYRTDAPFAFIPQNGETNSFSVKKLSLLLEFDHHYFEQLITEILFRVLGRTSPGDIAGSGLQDF